MPTNVSVEYSKAVEKYEQATTTHEKLLALQEMKSTAPGHKGAEKLRKEISKKLARLKSELEKQKKVSSKRGSGPTLNVRKEGAGQVVLVGMPNSGKSTLLNILTGVKAKVANFPFTTKKPEVGMMNYKGGLVQIVEVPAIISGSSKGKAQGAQLLSLVRSSDAIIFTIQSEREKKILVKELENTDILVNKEKPKIEITPTGFKGITINGKKFLKMKEAEFTEFLKGFGYYNASVLLKENTTKEKIGIVLNQKIVYKKAIFLNPKEMFDVENLKEKIFFTLGLMLIYTKKPGEKPDYNTPLVANKNETPAIIAKQLHKDFSKNLKFVRVWGSSKFDGQRVSKNYKLQHNDVIEIS